MNPEKILQIQHLKPFGRTDSGEDMCDVLSDLLPMVKDVGFDSVVLYPYDKNHWDPAWENHSRILHNTHLLLNLCDVLGLGGYLGIGQSKANFGSQSTIPTKRCGLKPLRPKIEFVDRVKRIAAGQSAYVPIPLPEDGEMRLYWCHFAVNGGRVRFGTVRNERFYPEAANALAMKTGMLPAGIHQIHFHGLECREWVAVFTAEQDCEVRLMMVSEAVQTYWLDEHGGRHEMAGPSDADTPEGWWEFARAPHIALRSPQYEDLAAREQAYLNLDAQHGEFSGHSCYRGFRFASDEPNGVGWRKPFHELFTNAGHGYGFDLNRLAARARQLHTPEPALGDADREQASNGAQIFDRMNAPRGGGFFDTPMVITEEAYLDHIAWGEPFTVEQMKNDLEEMGQKRVVAGIYMDYPQQVQNWRAAQEQTGRRVAKELYFSWDAAKFTRDNLRNILTMSDER